MSVRGLAVVFGAVCLLAGCGGGAGEVLRSADSIVLVGAEGDGDSMAGVGFGGTVAMVGDCVGIHEVTVNWPYGTTITSDDPLTIDVPGFGALKVGDQVAGGGQDYVDHLPEGIDAIPEGCPTDRVFAFHPDR